MRRVLPRLLQAVAAVAVVGLSFTAAAHAQARSPAQGHAPAGSSRAPQELLDAVRAALAAHPSLVAAGARADAAEALAREASAQRLPHLSADWAATRFAEPMIVAPLHGFDPQRPPRFERVLLQGGVTLGYTLFDGGARGARIGRAESLADAAAAGSSAAQQSLVAEVARAYLRVRAAQEVSEAHERRVQAVMRERERAAQLFDIGRTAQVTLLRAEAALSAARADRTLAAAELEAAQRELARLAGREPGGVVASGVASVRLARPDEALDRASLLSRAVAGNPELARLRLHADAADAGRAEARAAWLPRLQFAGRYAQYGSDAGGWQGEWQGGVQVSYPLFTGGARGDAVDRASAETRAARAELAAAELRLATALDGAIAALESARARVSALAAAVAQTEEVARIERLALDAGAGVQTDYLAAEAELFRARAAHTEARHAEIAARIELARITGELSLEWLARNLETGS